MFFFFSFPVRMFCSSLSPCEFLPLSQAAPVATLPSALFVERWSLGAWWVYSIHWVLLPDNRPLFPSFRRELGQELAAVT
jgi:hypothetical protein